MFKKINSFFERVIVLALLMLPGVVFADGSDDPIAKGLGWFINLILDKRGFI